MAIHESASKGYSTASDTYVRGRPDYPSEVLPWLRDVVGIGAGRSVLDVGAGTGKFIPLLRTTGARLMALEPVAEMRQRIARAHSDVTILAGTADRIPLPDGAVDAAVCAQAFHWFSTAEALGEIRRVLKPGGVLGLVWNVRDESVPWVAALSTITDPLEAGTPRYRTGEWRRVFPAQGFAMIDERSASNAHSGHPEQVIVDRTLSVSFIAAMPAEDRAVIASKVRALIETTPALAGSTDVAFPYVTRLFAYRKTG